MRTSLVARLTNTLRAATTTPVEPPDACHARFSGDDGLPRCYGESASTSAFRGLLGVHSRCGPQRPLTSFEAFSKGASAHSLPPGPPFVLPAGAQVGRVGFSPRINRALQGTHNNGCERAIRPFVIGRRNWLFADTPKGARASAALYSIIETANQGQRL